MWSVPPGEWDGMVWVWVKKTLSWWVEVGGKVEGKGESLSWWVKSGDKVEGKGGSLSWWVEVGDKVEGREAEGRALSSECREF